MASTKTTVNSNWKPKFYSQYSMGELDFHRFDYWIKWVEFWSAQINTTADPTVEQIQNYFAGLSNLYDSWKPIIAEREVTDTIDKNIEAAKKYKRILEQNHKLGLPYNRALIFYVVDILDATKRTLMDIKQKIGLGIIVRRKLTTKEKIRIGVRGYKIDEDGLPEK